MPCQEHRIWLDDRGYLHISVWFTTPEWEEAQGTDEVERVLQDIEDVHIRNLMSFFELFHVLECDVFEDVEEEDMIEYSLDARFGLVAPEKIVEALLTEDLVKLWKQQYDYLIKNHAPQKVSGGKGGETIGRRNR